jgi:hypothetical protein
MIGALEALGHEFDPHPVVAAVDLARCLRCGRIWQQCKCDNCFDSLKAAWLKLVEPTGWTLTPEKRNYRTHVDRVEHLSSLHQLLWNAEPCPGPPLSDSCEDQGNARYRLIAMSMIDLGGGPRNDPVACSEVAAWCAAPWAVRIAIDSIR